MDRSEKETKIRRIVDALKANGISYDKNFANLIARGYASDDCQELSDALVNDIYDIVGQSMNDGFENEDEIEDLIELALKLSDDKAVKKLKKYNEERSETLKKIKRETGEKDMDIKKEVIKYIELAEDAADALLLMHTTEMSDRKIEKSKELFQQLKETILSVWDNSTRAALQKAEEIENAVYEWLKCGLTMSCESRHIQQLEDAIEKAREWAQMDKAASERSFFGLGRKRDTDRATEEDIRETVAFKEDSRMIKRTRLFTKGATSLVESLASTQALYEREEKNIEEAYGTDEIQHEIDKNNEEIDEMMAKFTVGHMKIKNGEIRKESAEGQQIMRYSAYVVRERARLIERNTRLAGDIERNRQRRSIAKRSLDNVKDLLRELRTYQTRPAVFAVAAERLGIERLQLYIAGNMSSKEREEFISGVLQLRAWSVAETNRQQKEAEELENTTRLTDEYLRIEEPQPVVTQIEPNFEESYEQLANEIEGMQSTPQTQTTDEQEELLRNGGKKAFSDDEM